MEERSATFRCGDVLLHAVIHLVDSPADGIGIVFIVGGPQYRVGSHRQYVLMARSLASAGYPAIRFDARGMGDSDGTFPSFEGLDDDVKAAIDLFYDRQPGLRGVVLYGLCDGASATMIYCNRDSRVRGLILSNPWVSTPYGSNREIVRRYYFARLLQRSFWSKLWSGQLRVMTSLSDCATRVLTFLRRHERQRTQNACADFIERMHRGLAAFEGPTLIMISGRDLTASEFATLCQRSDRWSRLVSRPAVQLLTLPDADHTYSSLSSLQSATGEVLVWLERFGPRAQLVTAEHR